MGQDKIKFEKVLQKDWLNVPDKTPHNNSIVIVTDDNLIYTLGTHIGASKGNTLNNTIFYHQSGELPNDPLFNRPCVFYTPQKLTDRQKRIARLNIGAQADSGDIGLVIYQIVETSTNENEITSSVFNNTPIELWENTIMLDFQHFGGNTIQPLFKFAGKYETSVVISNNTNAGVSVLLSGELVLVSQDEIKVVIKSAEEYSSYEFVPYFVNNKSNSDISLSIPQNSSIEVNFLFIGNECRVIVLT